MAGAGSSQFPVLHAHHLQLFMVCHFSLSNSCDECNLGSMNTCQHALFVHKFFLLFPVHGCMKKIHRFYLKAARASAEVERMAKYLAVLALLDHEQLCYWRSTVAAGLVILASLAANQDASCQRVMEVFIEQSNVFLSAV